MRWCELCWTSFGLLHKVYFRPTNCFDGLLCLFYLVFWLALLLALLLPFTWLFSLGNVPVLGNLEFPPLHDSNPPSPNNNSSQIWSRKKGGFHFTSVVLQKDNCRVNNGGGRVNTQRFVDRHWDSKATAGLRGFMWLEAGILKHTSAKVITCIRLLKTVLAMKKTNKQVSGTVQQRTHQHKKLLSHNIFLGAVCAYRKK